MQNKPEWIALAEVSLLLLQNKITIPEHTAMRFEIRAQYEKLRQQTQDNVNNILHLWLMNLPPSP